MMTAWTGEFHMRVVCLVVAAGRGTRAMQADGVAKQYQHIGAVPVLTRTLRAFAPQPRVALGRATRRACRLLKLSADENDCFARHSHQMLLPATYAQHT